MRILVLSDIHGNIHALEAVLAAAGEFDQMWHLGDAVGYGGHPNEVLDSLRDVATINVRGNHDRVCCGLSSSHGFNPVAAQAAAWTERELTAKNLEWLRALPKGPLEAGYHATVAHGSPIHEDHYIVSMRDAWTPLQRMETDLTFFGHTHVQGGFSQNGADWQEAQPACGDDALEAGNCVLTLDEGARHLINPGSVGQPRDGDPRAAFAIYEPEQSRVWFARVPYDIAGAQKAIRAAGLPDRLAARLAAGR